MYFFHDHRGPGLSWFESSRWGLWSTAALIIASLAPCAKAVAVDPPQTQEDQTSSSPRYAELLPAEPQDSQPTLQEIEREARANTEIIQPHMRRRDFAALCKMLELDKAQTVCADDAFDKYDKQVQEIHQEVLDRVAPLAMQYRQALQEGGEELARAQAGGAVAVAAKIGERYQVQIRQGLDAFLGQLQTCFSESQLEAYPGALRAWRRSVMLNPHATDSGHDLAYHVDLLEVIEQACQGDVGLAALLDRRGEPPDDPAIAEARHKCLELLDAFELELDALIQRRFWRSWDRFFGTMVSWAKPDQAADQRRRRNGRRDWMRVYRLNTNAAESLGLIIQEASGKSLAGAWCEHYYAAYCPVLYSPKSTDHLYAWLLSEAALTTQQQTAVDAIYGQYIESRRALRTRTRSLLLGLTEELNLSSPGMISAHEFRGALLPKKRDLYEKRRALSRRATLQFRSILTTEQRPLADVAIARFQRGRYQETFEF